MERVHLPIVEEPRQELKTEREGSPEVNKKIAYAFLRQRYPLSERGRELQHRVRNAMDNGNDKAFEKLADDLPTVEEPHLELFEDFNLSVEDEEETFGRKIAVIKVTNGCSHQCLHCAAGASNEVEMMPYQAILQMTVHIQRCEARIDPAFNEWQSELERLNQSDAFRQLQARIVPLIDSSIDQHRGTVFEQTFDRLKKSLDKLDSWLFMKMYHILHLTKEHPGILLPDTEPIVKELDSFCAFLENRYAQYSISRLAQPTVIGMGEGILHDSCVVVPIIDSRRDVGENWGADICTHYDNDPFDYRDTRFLHRDGTPADYGDVVRSLVSIGKSVEFKTAGWKKSDRVALRAAEKISHLYQEHPGCVNGGVSIHPYGKLGRNTGETYWENIRHVLRTLSPLSTPDTKKMKHLDVICIYDLEFPSSPSDFQSDLQPIRKVCDEMGIVISRTKPAPVSRFSGRAATVQPRKSDWDVMACLPGYHLQPNGDIFIQNWVTRQSGAEEGKGERPQPTGRRLFTLT